VPCKHLGAAQPLRGGKFPNGMIGWEFVWVGATTEGRPWARAEAGRASGPVQTVHPFPFPNLIPLTPDVMRAETALNGSFSAAQSAENYARSVALASAPSLLLLLSETESSTTVTSLRSF
jgi:hypothetical protein